MSGLVGSGLRNSRAEAVVLVPSVTVIGTVARGSVDVTNTSREMLDFGAMFTGRSNSGSNCRNDAAPPGGCAVMCSTIDSDLRLVGDC